MLLCNIDKAKKMNFRVVIKSDGIFSNTLNSFQIGLVSQG